MAYIDRDKLLKFKEEMWKDRCDYMVVRVTNIMNLPTADVVEVKHSYWEDEKGNYVDFAKDGCPEHSCWCHNCKEWLVASDEYSCIGNYCPNCGAKMDRKEPTYCKDKQNHLRHCEDCHERECES